jgi:hypothetical protein
VSKLVNFEYSISNLVLVVGRRDLSRQMLEKEFEYPIFNLVTLAQIWRLFIGRQDPSVKLGEKEAELLVLNLI